MAMFDFLSQPVGGTSNQGIPNSGMNWSQFISAISSLGGQPPQNNNLINDPFAQFNQNSINQGFNQSNVPHQSSSFGGNTGQDDMQDINDIIQLASLYFGGTGAGAPTTTSTGTGIFSS